VDASGNAYVAGWTYSTNFPTVNPLPSHVNLKGIGLSSAFAFKLDATGSALVYSTYLAGNANDNAYAIAVDSSGNAIVVGSTSSSPNHELFPTVNALQANLGAHGATNAFVAKLDAAGSALIYSTYLGGNTSDTANGVAIDGAGNVYVTGVTFSTNFPTTPGAFQTTCGDCGPNKYSVAFVTKLNPAGSALVYSTLLGGSGYTYGYGIAIDTSGNAYISGFTTSTEFPTTAGAYQTTMSGLDNVGYVAKLNSTGSNLVYATYLETAGPGIALDSSGNTYVTSGGCFSSPPIVNPIVSTGPDYCGPYVTELNAAGTALVYSTPLGGSLGGTGYGIAVDASGNAYVTGVTASTDFPTTPGAFQTANAGLADAFVVKISPAVTSGITLSTTSLSFGSQMVNTTSTQESATLTNNGPGPLNLSSITVGGNFALVTTGTSCPYGEGTLAAQSDCTINVTFSPTTTGALTANVLITDNAANSPQMVTLTGTGTAPVAGVAPPSLTFGNQNQGTTSASQPVTLSNTGTATLTITSIGISANFGQSNTCGGSVEARSSCTINVTFSPTASGPLTGTLTVTDNSNGVAGSTQTVSLNGTGNTLQGTMSLSTTNLSFGNQVLNTTSGVKSVTVTNTGSGPLNVTSVAASAEYTATSTCTSPLNPGGGCTVNVTFTPTALGTQTGTLTLTSNATNSPQVVNLTGIGFSGVALSCTSCSLGSFVVGSGSGEKIVTLANAQKVALTNISVSIAGSNDYTQTNTCGTELGAGQTCAITVTFAPSIVGADDATLSITDSAANSPQTATLTGEGLASPAPSLAARSTSAK
jgi:hypothetical protein